VKPIVVNATRARFGSNNPACCSIGTRKSGEKLKKNTVIYT
jgi:hypothetical protein